jgi:hypothetical protein
MYVKKLRVLICENHERMRDCITSVLRTEFDVIGAVGDGYELVDTAMSFRPDVVVTDVSTTGLSAVDAQKRMKAEGIDIPFVFVTIDPILKSYWSRDVGPCIIKTELSCLNAEVQSTADRSVAPMGNGQLQASSTFCEG